MIGARWIRETYRSVSVRAGIQVDKASFRVDGLPGSEQTVSLVCGTAN